MDTVGEMSTGAAGPDRREKRAQGWRIVGCAVQGESHKRLAIPCQDTVGHWTSGEAEPFAASVMVLADGAGSARLSEQGSQQAVAAVIAAAKDIAASGTCPRMPLPAGGEPTVDRLPCADLAVGEILLCLFAVARRALQDLATEIGAPVHDLATTLMIGLVTEQGTSVGQIGDGVIAVLTGADALISPVPPQRGEFANESVFVTSGRDMPPPAISDLGPDMVDALALSSDGLRLVITSDVATGEPYRPFFDDVFASAHEGLEEEAIAHFLTTVDDRTGDDKSLVVGVRV